MDKPMIDPFLSKEKQPLMVCMTCGHFDPVINENEFEELAKAGCKHTGLSTVPPMHACSAWCGKQKKRK